MDKSIVKNSIGFVTTNVKALVVDDSLIDRSIISDFLSKIEISVDFANDGEEAVNKVAKVNYDIVFIDQQMPNMNGSEAIQMIRKIPDCKAVPIISVTSDSSDYTRCLLMYEGTNDCLIKPVSGKEIILMVEKWVSKDKIRRVSFADKNEFDIDFVNMEGIDCEKAVQFLGSRKIYMEFVSQYNKSYTRRKAIIIDSFQQRNMDKYSAAVHGLKEASKQIGAYVLSDMAARVEKAAKENDMVFVTRENFRMLKEYDNVIDKLKSRNMI